MTDAAFQVGDRVRFVREYDYCIEWDELLHTCEIGDLATVVSDEYDCLVLDADRAISDISVRKNDARALLERVEDD